MHSTAHSFADVDVGERPDARLFPGVLLALLACLPIAGTLLVAQILPQMEAAFPGTPDLRFRVSIALTIPALVIALCSWGTGWVADRAGRRRLLIGSLFFYAAFGLAPLFLQSLDAIIASRAAMGVAEGVIMTCSTALIGDLYAGARRERLLSLQTACASMAAVFFAIIGGVLGNLGWRAPFLVYGIALLVLPLVVACIPADRPVERWSHRRVAAADADRLPLAPLLAICGATLVMSLAFYAGQIQAPFLLNAIGAVPPSTVGLVSALANAAVVAGTACFPVVRRFPLRATSIATFACLAAGLAIAAAANSHMVVTLGLMLAGFAGGVALPTLLNGAMGLLSFRQRGQGTGLWQSSFWAGQFASPILVILLTGVSGTLPSAILLFALGALCIGGLLALLLPHR